MKRIETFVPEEGDKLVITQKVTNSELSVGDTVIFVNSIYLGAICKTLDTNQQYIIPQDALKAIYEGRIVDVTFE